MNKTTKMGHSMNEAAHFNQQGIAILSTFVNCENCTNVDNLHHPLFYPAIDWADHRNTTRLRPRMQPWSFVFCVQELSCRRRLAHPSCPTAQNDIPGPLRSTVGDDVRRREPRCAAELCAETDRHLVRGGAPYRRSGCRSNTRVRADTLSPNIRHSDDHAAERHLIAS